MRRIRCVFTMVAACVVMLWAGAVAAAPGGVPGPPGGTPPKGGLPLCQTDLTQAQASLTACEGTLITTEGALATCSTNLGTCNMNLGTCTIDLGTCNTDLGTCNTTLTQVQNDLGTCNANLGTCPADLSTCNSDLAACQVATCGNGTVEGTEQCDVDMLAGATCLMEGFAGGTLACGTGCTFDTSGCYTSRYVDNEDGTITDNQTGLMWEKKVAGSGCLHCVDDLYTWSSNVPDPDGSLFTDFLGELNNCVDDGNSPPTGVTGGFAGHCDWRVPNIVELQTIRDLGAGSCGDPRLAKPCIDPIFDNGMDSFTAMVYWSSTTNASVPAGAWVVSFGNSGVNFPVKSSEFWVRAVRGGW